MKRARLAVFVGLAFAITVVAVAVLRYVQWHRTETLVLPSGRTVADVPKSQTGPFGAPERVELRRRYLANLEWYRDLPMAPVRLDGATLVGAEHFIPAMHERLSVDAASNAALSELPKDAASDLGRALTLVYARMAGMPRDAYRNQLVVEREWQGPPILPEHWDAVPGRKATDPAEATFATEYDKLELDDGQLTAVASSAEGWRIVVRKVTSSRGGNEFVLFETCSANDVERFGGGLGIKALNFHHWPADWETFARTHPTMHVAEASTIIQTANGDRYPLHTVFVYNADAQRWRLTKAFRQVTVRVARIGSLAF